MRPDDDPSRLGSVLAPSGGRDPLGATSGDYLVLTADDDPTSRRVLENVLRRAGHRTVCARGGEEALALAREQAPDLILLDIAMPPGIDGYETIRRIVADTKLRDTPVIVLSSMNDPGDKVRALTLGAVDYVSKPFRAEEVIARVKTHLMLRSLQRDLAARNAQLELVNRRMKHDLEAAGRVHRAMLPKSVPECAGYELAWACRPCFEVGGDSLDIFRIDAETLGFYLLDVSGHGVAPCLLAVSVARSLVPHLDRSSLVVEPGSDAASRRIVPPGEVLRRLNSMNPMEPDRNPHFITMVYGTLHCPSGKVRFAAAGHPGPMVLRADGTTAILDTPSFPIGIEREAEFEESEIQLAQNDRLYLYSDGAFEPTGPDDQPFGVERLAAVLSRETSVYNAIGSAVSRIVNWTAPNPLADDLSLIGVGRTR